MLHELFVSYRTPPRVATRGRGYDHLSSDDYQFSLLEDAFMYSLR